MKKIAILQSNYIPWKGYFDLINLVDEFIYMTTCSIPAVTGVTATKSKLHQVSSGFLFR